MISSNLLILCIFFSHISMQACNSLVKEGKACIFNMQSCNTQYNYFTLFEILHKMYFYFIRHEKTSR